MGLWGYNPKSLPNPGITDQKKKLISRKNRNFQYIQENVGFSQTWDFTNQDMMCLPASLLFDGLSSKKEGFTNRKGGLATLVDNMLRLVHLWWS